jgi:Tfp pilus assembly protein PilX
MQVRRLNPMRPNLGVRQRGVALPVMLIILAVLLVGSIYLLRSTHSTTLTTGNLAYDATLSKQADLGLHTGFEWLRSTSAANKAVLNQSSAAAGYVAHLDTTQTPRDAQESGFWAGSKTIAGPVAGTEIEYVIHRLCAMDGGYDEKNNRCVQTSEESNAGAGQVAFGQSSAVDTPDYAGTPMLHYVITARISGSRGASVTNQMIVLIGA